ncbi:hypothetical protein ACFQL1_01615 [Halomicroarcula sp. GCM10025709]|uniref:hypothetical protein n=1 Tax=Halomicroarcula sp. GCM10025709 TaxID=3252669 RepID=UPI0036092F24
MAIAGVAIYLEWGPLTKPGFPYPNDFFSNLIPVLHARASVASGELPLYTEQWYGGEWQFANPLWKGFYPPWWPMFLPWVPMLAYYKFLYAAHIIATAAVSYVYGRRYLNQLSAGVIALLFTLIIIHFNGHIEKVLSWPWIVLGCGSSIHPRSTPTPLVQDSWPDSVWLQAICLGASILGRICWWPRPAFLWRVGVQQR